MPSAVPLSVRTSSYVKGTIFGTSLCYYKPQKEKPRLLSQSIKQDERTYNADNGVISQNFFFEHGSHGLTRIINKNHKNTISVLKCYAALTI